MSTHFQLQDQFNNKLANFYYGDRSLKQTLTYNELLDMYLFVFINGHASTPERPDDGRINDASHEKIIAIFHDVFNKKGQEP